MSSQDLLDDPRVLVYRLRSERSMQPILSGLRSVDRPDLVAALGTRSGGDWFVVGECHSFVAETRARRVVAAVDPSARQDLAVRPAPWHSVGSARGGSFPDVP